MHDDEGKKPDMSWYKKPVTRPPPLPTIEAGLGRFDQMNGIQNQRNYCKPKPYFKSGFLVSGTSSLFIL